MISPLKMLVVGIISKNLIILLDNKLIVERDPRLLRSRGVVEKLMPSPYIEVFSKYEMSLFGSVCPNGYKRISRGRAEITE